MDIYIKRITSSISSPQDWWLTLPVFLPSPPPACLPSGPHFVAVNNKNEIVVTDFHNHSVKVWPALVIIKDYIIEKMKLLKIILGLKIMTSQVGMSP